MSILRTLIGVGGACLFAWLLFRYSIFSLGLPLIAFFVNLLMFGWAIGLAVSAMILRWGLGAEELAWAAIFLFAPVSGVYYPIAVLPRVAAGDRLGAAVGVRVRGHARGAAATARSTGRCWHTALVLNVVYLAVGCGAVRAGRCATRATRAAAADGRVVRLEDQRRDHAPAFAEQDIERAARGARVHHLEADARGRQRLREARMQEAAASAPVPSSTISGRMREQAARSPPR